MLNELISNTLTNAFPNKNEGEVHIEIKQLTSNKCVLNSQDIINGYNLMQSQKGTLGIEVVKIPTKQLQGKFIKEVVLKGARYTVYFIEFS